MKDSLLASFSANTPTSSSPFPNTASDCLSSSSSLPSGVVLSRTLVEPSFPNTSFSSSAASDSESWSALSFFTGGVDELPKADPPCAYDLKAFVIPPRREGLLLLFNPEPRLEDDPLPRKKPVGDFDLFAALNGEDDVANASNPVRFTPVGGDEERPDEANAAKPDGVAFVGMGAAGVGIADVDGALEKAPVDFGGAENPVAGSLELLALAFGTENGVDLEPKITGPFARANGDATPA